MSVLIGNGVAVVLVLLLVAACIREIAAGRKSGGCAGCSGSCSSCASCGRCRTRGTEPDGKKTARE